MGGGGGGALVRGYARGYSVEIEGEERGTRDAEQEAGIRRRMKGVVDTPLIRLPRHPCPRPPPSIVTCPAPAHPN
eukprot:8404534-Pyramimonas_sp.AAC.1